tara:strand:+ start:930 stop:1157 length:228 start_codon:yes stop_codon:yes gene_type:complete
MTAPLFITLHYLDSGGEVHVNTGNICWMQWRTWKDEPGDGCTDLKFFYEEADNEDFCSVRETPKEILAMMGREHE